MRECLIYGPCDITCANVLCMDRVI